MQEVSIYSSLCICAFSSIQQENFLLYKEGKNIVLELDVSYLSDMFYTISISYMRDMLYMSYQYGMSYQDDMLLYVYDTIPIYSYLYVSRETSLYSVL